jgi:hypothetical protein
MQEANQVSSMCGYFWGLAGGPPMIFSAIANQLKIAGPLRPLHKTESK